LNFVGDKRILINKLIQETGQGQPLDGTNTKNS